MHHAEVYLCAHSIMIIKILMEKHK
jgi:hypothetical protein